MTAGHRRRAARAARPVLGDGVNYVNAPIIARERGIRVVEIARRASRATS